MIQPSATAPSSPTTPRRSPRSRPTSSSTPRSPPTCSTRPAAATRSTSCAEERGIAADAGDELATCAVLIHELAKRQRPLIDERGLSDLLDTVELPLVRVLRETEKAGIKLDTQQLETVATRIKAQVIELEREIWELADEEFMIGSPQQLGADPVREARALAASAAARPASAPTTACCRRSATSTRSSRRSSATASCPSSPRPTWTRSRTGSATTAACTRRSSRRPRPPGA